MIELVLESIQMIGHFEVSPRPKDPNYWGFKKKYIENLVSQKYQGAIFLEARVRSFQLANKFGKLSKRQKKKNVNIDKCIKNCNFMHFSSFVCGTNYKPCMVKERTKHSGVSYVY